MTNQFSNMSYQNEGLKGHTSFQVRKLTQALLEHKL